jgi:two-component system osmolarity sensor histidine kinase EnvZ
VNAPLSRLTLALIAGCVVLVLAVAATLMSWHTLAPGSRHMARLLAANVATQEALIRNGQPLPDDAAVLGITWSMQAPPITTPRTPLGHALLRELSALRPDWQVAVADRDDARVVVRVASGHWIGLPFQPLSDSVLQASFWILATAAALVIAAAAWLARRISAPLVELADKADALLDGQIDRAAFRTAPREVATLANTLAELAALRQRQRAERDAWLAGLSHDLRTPLARLRFAIELHGSTNDDEQRAMAADIDEMDTLIGQFVSLIREGKNEAESVFDLSELLHLVSDSFARQADLRVTGADEPRPFRGHAFALRRALGNLVQNALRHGAPPVDIGLAVHTDTLSITVRNAARVGEGSGAEGFGIGLSVVRMVAELHRGRFDITSHDDGSTTATLHLPCPRSP